MSHQKRILEVTNTLQRQGRCCKWTQEAGVSQRNWWKPWGIHISRGTIDSPSVDFHHVGIGDKGQWILQVSNRSRTSRCPMWNFLIFKTWCIQKKKSPSSKLEPTSGQLWTLVAFTTLLKPWSLGSTNNLPNVRHLERDRTGNRTQICSYLPYLCHSSQRRKLMQFSQWLFPPAQKGKPELGHHRERSRSQAINIEGSLPRSPPLSSVSHGCIISPFEW